MIKEIIFNKYEWDLMHDPGIVTGLFESDTSGQMSMYLSLYDQVDNPINIGFGGGVPKSVAIEKYKTTTPLTIKPGADDPPNTKPIAMEISVSTYSLTELAIHFLSLVSGISETDITKIEIRNNGGGILPMYNPSDGGGAITFPGNNNTYRINLTDNYFSNKYGDKSYQDNSIQWLRILSHEVGHIKDIQDIGKDKLGYFFEFAKGYAAVGFNHDQYWREQRSEKGRKEFDNFRNFIKVEQLKSFFEDDKTSLKEKIKKLDDWWNKYLKK